MHRCSSSSSALLAFTGWSVLSSTAAADANSDCVKGIAVPDGEDYSDWPALFRLTSEYPDDPTLPNRDDVAGPVDPAVVRAAGVEYRHFDPAGFAYPNGTMAIPWSPPANGPNDAALQDFRDARDYQYADVVNVTAYNPGYYEEHIHAGGDEVRYVLDGSGYFDIRDVHDDWVRVHARAGDLIVFPSGIEHRFAVDEAAYVQAMRLFPGTGDPDWSSVPRAEVRGNNTARAAYVDEYLCGIDPDAEHEHAAGEGEGGAEEAANDAAATSGRGPLVLRAVALVAGAAAFAL